MRHRVWQAIISAFSTFTTLPTPSIRWTDNSLQDTLLAFPLTGLAVGLCQGIGWIVAGRLELTAILTALITMALGVFLTGGIHLDGFCDTADAFLSHRTREEKLRIMKDPHCGSMAVICLFFHLTFQWLLWADLLSLEEFSEYFLEDRVELILVWMLISMFNRVISGGLVALLPKARPDGMAQAMSHSVSSATKVGFLMELLSVFVTLAWITHNGLFFLKAFAALLLATALFVACFVRPLKGMTGDLAGFWLCVEETLWLIIFVFVQKE